MKGARHSRNAVTGKRKFRQIFAGRGLNQAGTRPIYGASDHLFLSLFGYGESLPAPADRTCQQQMGWLPALDNMTNGTARNRRGRRDFCNEFVASASGRPVAGGIGSPRPEVLGPHDQGPFEAARRKVGVHRGAQRRGQQLLGNDAPKTLASRR